MSRQRELLKQVHGNPDVAVPSSQSDLTICAISWMQMQCLVISDRLCRHNASIISNQALFFVFIVDACESELGILDLIQVFVEALDRSFQSICELDLFSGGRVLDEIISGGIAISTQRIQK